MFTFKPFAGAAFALLMITSCHNKNNDGKDISFLQKKNDAPSTEMDKTTAKLSPPSANGTANEDIPVNNDQQYQLADSIAPPDKQPAQTPVQAKSQAPIVVTDWSKKIIKNATVKLEVKDFKTYNDGLGAKLKQYGAYVSQEDNNLTESGSEAVLSIKVPVQYFDDLMAALPSADAKLMEKSIRSEDVTGDIVDTRSRLEAKKQMRLKYLDFLKESKNMTEVLQVQDEINGIQEEIESASGRFASLTTQAAYSTINLTFFKGASTFKEPDAKPGFLSKLSESFSSGASWLSTLFIGLISIWPLLLLAFAAIIIYRKRKPAKIPQQNV
jgi:hypothetical protein